VVGLGTQDSLGAAKKFVDRHKMKTTKMVWGASAESWAFYGVPSQPAFVLVDASGNNVLKAGSGEIPYEEILKLTK
jgi:thioredoxin-related protein